MQKKERVTEQNKHLPFLPEADMSHKMDLLYLQQLTMGCISDLISRRFHYTDSKGNMS